MEFLNLINKKREGLALTPKEIEEMIRLYMEDHIPDYQMSAFLMAVCFQGMNEEETFALTKALRDSGEVLDLRSIPGLKADKHSTGGVGDKTTLIVGPLAAAAGVKVAKMSGRGLGFTGGTADKLASIPGYRTTLTNEEFLEQMKTLGIVMVTQTAHLTPADKRLYSLRDVTGTVSNKSLIASSIMSKKLASGSDVIVLDVKCGRGALLEDPKEAEELANLMLKIGVMDGKRMTALITDMSEPLGLAIGNALEVEEAVEVLRGGGPSDVREVSVALTGEMIYLSELAATPEEGRKLAERLLEDGSGLSMLRRVIEAQGGDARIVDDTSILPKASLSCDILAEKEGYVHTLDARTIGIASQHSGAGRMTMEDEIDPGAGILLRKKRGDRAAAGEVLATVYSSEERRLREAVSLAKEAFGISREMPEEQPCIEKELRI